MIGSLCGCARPSDTFSIVLGHQCNKRPSSVSRSRGAVEADRRDCSSTNLEPLDQERHRRRRRTSESLSQTVRSRAFRDSTLRVPWLRHLAARKSTVSGKKQQKHEPTWAS